MGNSTQMSAKYNLPDHQFWRPLNPSNTTQENPNRCFKTLKNRLNGKLIDQYIVQFFSKEQEEQYKNWIYMRSKSQYLVKIFSYIPFERSWCSNQTEKAYIYIQHFPFRFKDINCIGFLECLYLIKSGLIGFSELYNQIGFFEIQQQFMNFTKKGEVKLWINKNLSKIQLEVEKHKRSSENEQAMALKLIDLVQRKIYDNPNVLTFSQYGRTRNIKFKSFEETLKILDSYITKMKFQLPSRLNLQKQSILKDQKPKLRRSLSNIKIGNINQRRNRQSFHPSNWSSWMEELKNQSIQQSRIITIWQDKEFSQGKREGEKTGRQFLLNKASKVQKHKFSFKEISKDAKVVSSQTLTRPESSFYLETEPFNKLQITLGPHRNHI